MRKSVETLSRSRVRAARPALAVAGLLALTLAGCGGAGEDVVTPEAQSTSAAGAAATALTLKVTDDAGKSTTQNLTCQGTDYTAATGTVRDPGGACRVLATKGAQALPAVPTDRVCTQIFGGADTAELTGTLDGKAVTASFSRKNGCEIARWDMLAPLLPKLGTGNGVAPQ